MAAREDSEVKNQFQENQQMLAEEQQYKEYKKEQYKETRKNVEDSTQEESPKK